MYEKMRNSLTLMGLEKDTYEIYRFSKGEQLLASSIIFDLVLQDIELGDGMDGITVGYKLKQWNISPLIIFLTYHDDLRDDGYDVGNFWYLEKSASEESFHRAIRSAIAQIRDIKWITFDYVNEYDEREKISLRTNEVIYIEAKSGKTCVKTRSGTWLVTTYSLKDWMKKLPLDKFMKCHRSYIVNLDYATLINRTELVYNLDLKTGGAISVSGGNIKELNARLHARLRHRGRF